jgi:hypothetical protein
MNDEPIDYGFQYVRFSLFGTYGESVSLVLEAIQTWPAVTMDSYAVLHIAPLGFLCDPYSSY